MKGNSDKNMCRLEFGPKEEERGRAIDLNCLSSLWFEISVLCCGLSPSIPEDLIGSRRMLDQSTGRVTTLASNSILILSHFAFFDPRPKK
jgi:hypothetical protein